MKKKYKYGQKIKLYFYNYVIIGILINLYSNIDIGLENLIS